MSQKISLNFTNNEYKFDLNDVDIEYCTKMLISPRVSISINELIWYQGEEGKKGQIFSLLKRNNKGWIIWQDFDDSNNGLKISAVNEIKKYPANHESMFHFDISKYFGCS